MLPISGIFQAGVSSSFIHSLIDCTIQSVHSFLVKSFVIPLYPLLSVRSFLYIFPCSLVYSRNHSLFRMLVRSFISPSIRSPFFFPFSVRSFIFACSFIHSFVPMFLSSFFNSFARSFIDLHICLCFNRSLIYSIVRSFTHSFVLSRLIQDTGAFPLRTTAIGRTRPTGVEGQSASNIILTQKHEASQTSRTFSLSAFRIQMFSRICHSLNVVGRLKRLAAFTRMQSRRGVESRLDCNGRVKEEEIEKSWLIGPFSI